MTPWWVNLVVAALLVVLGRAGAQLTAGPTQEPERPALDRFVSQGDIQVAEAHLRERGFDPGPVDGIFTVQTQATVRAFQPDTASRSRDCSIARPAWS